MPLYAIIPKEAEAISAPTIKETRIPAAITEMRSVISAEINSPIPCETMTPTSPPSKPSPQSLPPSAGKTTTVAAPSVTPPPVSPIPAGIITHEATDIKPDSATLNGEISREISAVIQSAVSQVPLAKNLD